MRAHGGYLILFLLVLATGCHNSQTEESSPLETKPAVEVTKQKVRKIVAFGNSLTAGLGLPLPQSYPAILQKLLEADGFSYEVVNAGVSGDTTAGGLRRLEWSLEGDVEFVIIELGGNDILRGQPISVMKENLAGMIEKAQSKGIRVLLAGMEAPTNAGPEYREEVHTAYDELAKQYDVIFIPFFLKDLIGKEGVIQEDGTHPTAEGSRILAETVYSHLKPLLHSQTQSPTDSLTH